MTKLAERERERNISFEVYQANLDFKKHAKEERAKAAKIVKGKDFQPKWNGHGYTTYLIDPKLRYADGKLPATKQLHIFKEMIPPGGSNIEHKHLQEAVVFLLYGRGHTFIGGEKDEERATSVGDRYEWEAGDLIMVPPNMWHVFINDDQEKPALFLGITTTLLDHLGIAEMEHHGSEGRKPWDDETTRKDFEKYWREAQEQAANIASK